MRTVPSMATVACSLGLALALQAPAFAQEPPATPDPEKKPAVEGSTPAPAGKVTKETYPSAFVDRPLTLVAGQLQIWGVTGTAGMSLINISLNTGVEFKKFVVAPAISYGVTDQLQLTLFHANSLCLGETAVCPKIYNDVGIAAHYYAITEGKFLLAAHLSVQATSFDPFGMAIGAGALMQIALTDKFSIFVDPTVIVNVTPSPASVGLGIPIQLGYQITPELYVALLTGFNVGNFDGFNWSIPVGVMAMYTISRIIDVGLEFALDSVASKAGGDAAAAKHLAVMFAVRI